MTIEPLTRPHYWWAPNSEIIDAMDVGQLEETVRLTRTACVAPSWGWKSGKWQHRPYLEHCVDACRQHDGSLALLFHPFGLAGDVAYDDLSDCQGFLIKMLQDGRYLRGQLDELNSGLGTPIAISAVLLNAEAWQVTAENRDVIRGRHNSAYAMAQMIAPEARVIWYCKRTTLANQVGDLHTSMHMAGDELGADGVRLYEPWDTGGMRRAIEHMHVPGESLDAWISLGAGYLRLSAVTGKWHEWVSDLEYNSAFSWVLGEALSKRRSPWSRIDQVVIYPCPWRSEIGMRHLAAYAQGWHRLVPSGG